MFRIIPTYKFVKQEIEDMYACILTTDDVNSFIVFQHICGQEIFTAYNRVQVRQ